MRYGLVADSAGNIGDLERAIDVLLAQGAERVAFLGGYWTDLDAVFQRKREKRRGRAEYTDADFLGDVARFMAKQELADKGAAVARAAKQDEVDGFIARLVRVPDRDSLQYRDPQIAVKLPELVGGLLACLVHDKGDLTKEDIANATLLLHGRGKEPRVVQIGPRFFVTPGRVAGGEESACALIDVVEAGVSLVAMDLAGNEIRREKLAIERRTKVSAK